MEKASRICITGPGAIGGVVAGILTRKGYNTRLVVKHPEPSGNRGLANNPEVRLHFPY